MNDLDEAAKKLRLPNLRNGGVPLSAAERALMGTPNPGYLGAGNGSANPNLANGMSAEAKAFQNQPRGAFSAPSTGRTINPPRRTGLGRAALGGALGKAAVVGGMGYDAYKAADNVMEGDYAGAAGRAGKVGLGAGALLGGAVAAPLSAAALGGHAVGGAIYDHGMSEDTQNTIGGTINAGLRRFGMGVDDSALLDQQVAERMARPQPAAPAPQEAAQESARPGLAAAADPRQAYIEQSNARMGLPIEAQRGAIDMSRQGLRGANAAQAKFQGPVTDDIRPTYNLGTYGGDAAFYGRAKPGSNRVTEFTATGTGQDDGGARQAMLTQQSIDRMNRSSELQRENAGLRQGLNDRNSGYLQPGGGASLGGGGFGGAVTAATMNARNNREGNRIADTNNQRTTDVSLANGLRTAATAQRQAEWERTKMGVEQGNKDREFGLRSQEFARAGEQQGFAQKETREKSIQAKLEAQNMIEGDDGKPTIDVNAVRAQRVGIDRAVARLGAKGVQDLSPMLEQQLIAGSKLLAKVQADGSNLNPFKPDFLKTMDPLDLINMRRLPNGDAQLTTNGQIIPKRYIEKVMSELVLPGTPTNEFDILFQKAK